MNEKRGSLYLLTGVVLGLILGLGYAWVLRPLEYVDTSPASLKEEYKDKYRVMIALAYVADGDLVRAKARLGTLKDKDVYQALGRQAQQALSDGSSPDEARALGLLLVALGQGANPAGTPNPAEGTSLATRPGEPATGSPGAVTAYPPSSPTGTVLAQPPTLPASPAPENTSTATPQPSPGPPSPIPDTPVPTQPSFTSGTPAPTLTPTITPGAPFVLDDRELACEQDLGEPLVQIQVFDASGQPVPNIEVVMTWEGGEEHFFTGLKPELGLGYADFKLASGVVYTLRLAQGGQPVEDLTATQCDNPGGQKFWGAWQLKFVQP